MEALSGDGHASKSNVCETPVRQYKGGEGAAFISARKGERSWEGKIHMRVHPDTKARLEEIARRSSCYLTDIVRAAQEIEHRKSIARLVAAIEASKKRSQH